MCFGDGNSSAGGSHAPRPVQRQPLSIERPSRVAVPAQAHLTRRPANQTQNIPLSVLTPKETTQRQVNREAPVQRVVNTYTQPNPWPPELVLEYANYKAADHSHGVASSRYWRERRRREEEVDGWTVGRKTYAPMNLTPESHYELRPMAVDWKDKAQTHYGLRKGFDDAHPRAYESPEAKARHQKKNKDTKDSVHKAEKKVVEHELYQGNFMQCDPYDSLDWATAGSSKLPNGQRRQAYNYDK